MIQFPKDFLWGAATSAYQVEGWNAYADWWHWEKKAGKETSGAACRHYDFFQNDFDLAKNLHHNAHRLSVEWSRIEPEEGKFSEEAIGHYAEVLLALRARGIEPVVTLHHFTNPQWLAPLGGWESRKTLRYFLRYATYIVHALAPHVRYWITINEPTIYSSHAYLFGAWPPQARSLRKMIRVDRRMMRAHIETYRQIHKIYKELDLPVPKVGIAQHLIAIAPATRSLKDRFGAFLRHKLFNERYLDTFRRHRAMDFIGVNYYSRQVAAVKRWGLRNLLGNVPEKSDPGIKKNSLGWDIYPEGFGRLLLKLKKYGLPIMITENGICTSDDNERWDFIREHLREVHRALEQGVPVTGYLYWSLLDNFEWDKGFGPRFGLVNVDYDTQERTVRESALKFAEVCRTGVLPEDPTKTGS